MTLALLLGSILLLFFGLIVYRTRWGKALGRARALETELSRARAAISRLSKWEGVADADAKATELLVEARKAAEALRAEATRFKAEAMAEGEALKSAAQDEAKLIRSAAAEKASDSRERAEAVIAAADARAKAIVAEAEAKAEALAGDALKALQQADHLERTIMALENKIEGYGDEYLIPSHSLIDDLAEGVGQTEAGQALKSVRESIRQDVKLERAAECDYVEANRKETAIRFVTDAFNGKADTILARVKSDNAGTLQQELRDAYTLVNHNGQAFRNARITEAFLALRLEELKWASVAYQLKEQEREEQRRIKEQIREEEKARKEYERAIRDAAKEEDAVRKAMEKATAQLAKASDEQKAKYEAQLTELNARLAAAEQRNQRALSMAQQTRRGHVYIISNIGSFGENVYKIGLTRRLEPLDRIRELGDSSVPYEFDVHALIFAGDAPGLEHQLHRHFVLAQVNKVNYRKEFFRVDLAHVRTEIEKLGLTATWTMAAAAQEYRESQAIERLIEKNLGAREAWLKRQLSYETEAVDSGLEPVLASDAEE